MKPGCPGSEASAGTLVEGQLGHYTAQQPALRASWGEQTRQGRLARQSGSLHPALSHSVGCL